MSARGEFTASSDDAGDANTALLCIEWFDKLLCGELKVGELMEWSVTVFNVVGDSSYSCILSFGPFSTVHNR